MPSDAFKLFKEAAAKEDKVFFAYDVGKKKLLYLNPAFENTFKISIREACDNPLKVVDLIHHEDYQFLSHAYHDLLSETDSKNLEFRIIQPEKQMLWLSINVHKIHLEDNNIGIAGLVEDINDIKEKENNLQKFAAKKDSIMEILSHDLAGPLNNIKGIASLLAKELKDLNNPELDKMVEIVDKTSERGIRLIREFVKHEFLQSENSALVKHRVDIVDIIRQVIEQYKESATDISKTFNLNVPNEPVFIKVDTYKFTQVLNNLVSNSIKFTDDKGIITVTLENKRDTVLLQVADNGIGIPDKHQKHLFDKFTKARRSGLRGEPSVGLGMSIIKTIVEWHGGKIWFQSNENEGTTFFIELPKE